jgi:CRP-like cAMP-binding protein
MTFAQQLNWVPKMISGMPQFGLLHCIPFMTVLDNRSKILICSKLVFCTFKRFDHTSIRSNESGAGRRITVEGQPGSDMYIVISGRIAVVQDHQVLGYLEKKGFFCENSILQSPRIGSYGQLQRRTHYAVDKDAVVAALGFEDFQELRRTRPAINDAALPYIRELQGREATSKRWFYIEIDQAAGIRASDIDSLASEGSSDAYCVIFLDGQVIDKTEVRAGTLNPVWRYTVSMTRKEVARWGDKADTLEIRFELYDHDKLGNPDCE